MTCLHDRLSCRCARSLPASGPRADHRFPPFRDVTLPSGLRIVAVRTPSAPMVELRLRIPHIADTPQQQALAELAATLLFAPDTDGPRRRYGTSRHVHSGRVGAVRGMDCLAITAYGLTDRLGELLDLVAGELTGPSLTEQAVERARHRVNAQCAVLAADPRVRAAEALFRHCLGESSGRGRHEAAQHTAAVTPTSLAVWTSAALTSRGSVLVLVGDIEPDDAIASVASSWAGWQAQAPADPLPRPHDLVRPHGLRFIPLPGAHQSHIVLAAPAVSPMSPAYPSLDIANTAFGGAISSRLSQSLRDRHGAAYLAQSGVVHPGGRPLLVAQAATRTDRTATTLERMCRELARMRCASPTAAECDAARAYLVGSMLTALSSQASFASLLADLLAADASPGWIAAHPQRLDDVTPREVADAAARYFAPDRFTGVVVGDPACLPDLAQASRPGPPLITEGV
ncbi:M16 family metallopeptidase [Streptomyces sp. CRN 30]|uniref:M16 family metallopeptidase n=1 Tax=Streptomyces sp. CRN 30 TaxID=3075613 RepID=UPI002A820B59|nr:insulinase family protein [Streptomyces sp. CRN 30]